MSTQQMVLATLAAAIATVSSGRAQQQSEEAPNLLVVVLDDVGVDMIGAYQEGTDVERFGKVVVAERIHIRRI